MDRQEIMRLLGVTENELKDIESEISKTDELNAKEERRLNILVSIFNIFVSLFTIGTIIFLSAYYSWVAGVIAFITAFVMGVATSLNVLRKIERGEMDGFSKV